MSYILNALRKSERERQAIEPDSVTSRIVSRQPPRNQNSTRLIALLILINLAFIVYFLGFSQKTPPASAAQPVASAVMPEKSARAALITPPTTTPKLKLPAPKPPVIAQIVDPKIPASSAAPKPLSPTVAIKKPPTIEPAKPTTPPPTEPAVQKVQPVVNAVEKPKPAQIKSDLPFLDDLPAEFRRSLPDFHINVFSFSPVPTERFVMIDMVKYVVGQRIKDMLELKEIRSDSIVVGYEDQTFIIKRP